MVKAEKVRPVTPFTAAFSSALRVEMQGAGVTQTAVAELLGRDQSFVSERTSGKRPCDTDIIAAIAELAETSPRDLVSKVLRRMKEDAVVIDLSARRDGRSRSEDPTVKKAARNPGRPGSKSRDSEDD